MEGFIIIMDGWGVFVIARPFLDKQLPKLRLSVLRYLKSEEFKYNKLVYRFGRLNIKNYVCTVKWKQKHNLTKDLSRRSIPAQPLCICILWAGWGVVAKMNPFLHRQATARVSNYIIWKMC